MKEFIRKMTHGTVEYDDVCRWLDSVEEPSIRDQFGALNPNYDLKRWFEDQEIFRARIIALRDAIQELRTDIAEGLDDALRGEELFDLTQLEHRYIKAKCSCGIEIEYDTCTTLISGNGKDLEDHEYC